ncbi:MAG: type II toxin-antitoxin system VapC family toxin [candidate division KSB1 bacterium]|nr:type II toxin-antitoxin system VapC family toxin [candidate division KSB1 bacterium]
MDERNYQKCLKGFEFDYQHIFSSTNVTLDILQRAMALIKKHCIRAYDGIQLASALEVFQVSMQELNQMVTFVSADSRLWRPLRKKG